MDVLQETLSSVRFPSMPSLSCFAMLCWCQHFADPNVSLVLVLRCYQPHYQLLPPASSFGTMAAEGPTCRQVTLSPMTAVAHGQRWPRGSTGVRGALRAAGWCIWDSRPNASIAGLENTNTPRTSSPQNNGRTS